MINKVIQVIYVLLFFAAGNIVCSWGRGEDGQLGHGDAEDRYTPTRVTALDGKDIISVICGADHTAAYSESLMQVYSWGWYAFLNFIVDPKLYFSSFSLFIGSITKSKLG